MRRKRRIRGPTARRRRSIRNEETGQYNKSGQQKQPERQSVEERKRQVRRSNFERNQKVPKNSHQQWHHDEKNHDCRVHRQHGIVNPGLDGSARCYQPTRQQSPNEWNRYAWKRQLVTNTHRKKTADQEEEKARKQ